MSTYAIGDIQGCQSELLALLQHINFDQDLDTLWFTGDLVNRGPNSLETLRYVRQLGSSAVTVLGNHDLHLLAIAHGQEQYMHKDDTIEDILRATDRDELLNWLRMQPLMHIDKNTGFAMVHAGLAPQWSVQQAGQLASEVEEVLRSESFQQFFSHMYGNNPDNWTDQLQGWERLRVITNYLTRLRYCDTSGRMNFSEKHSPGDQAEDLLPWFEVPGRKSMDTTILFGHWAALRKYDLDSDAFNIHALDTGCLWGGDLTALRLEDMKYFSVPGLQRS